MWLRQKLRTFSINQIMTSTFHRRNPAKFPLFLTFKKLQVNSPVIYCNNRTIQLTLQKHANVYTKFFLLLENFLIVTAVYVALSPNARIYLLQEGNKEEHMPYILLTKHSMTNHTHSYISIRSLSFSSLRTTSLAFYISHKKDVSIL